MTLVAWIQGSWGLDFYSLENLYHRKSEVRAVDVCLR
jgi:hypothetical protein